MDRVLNDMHSKEISRALRVPSKASVALQLLTALRIRAYWSDSWPGNVYLSAAEVDARLDGAGC